MNKDFDYYKNQYEKFTQYRKKLWDDYFGTTGKKSKDVEKYRIKIDFLKKVIDAVLTVSLAGVYKEKKDKIRLNKKATKQWDYVLENIEEYKKNADRLIEEYYEKYKNK